MEKILVIEDENEVRTSIIDLLDAAGYDTISASDGLEALKAVRNCIPDLVISDIMMPRMDGYSVLDEFQKDPATAAVPFIFLTAKVEPSDIRKGMNKGADDYVIKPFKAKELLRTIEIRLEKKRRYDKKLKEIADNVSLYVPHELRTPLVAIFGFTDLISENLDGLSKNEILEMLDKIKKSSKRLHRTIEKFLLYTDIILLDDNSDVNKRLLGTSTENTDDLIEIMVKEKASSYLRLEDVEMDLAPASLKIFMDHFQVIIEELIDNAIKFSTKGTKIKVKSFVEGENFILKITDHGRGMTNEQINSIAPFIQHQRRIFEQGGNGLGLVIVQKIAELYGGKFLIESEPGKYTMAVISLTVSAK